MNRAKSLSAEYTSSPYSRAKAASNLAEAEALLGPDGLHCGDHVAV